MDDPAPVAVAAGAPPEPDPLARMLARMDERARGYDVPRDWIQNLSPAVRASLPSLN